MYTRFFGLNEKPFSITPDPRYLFMSERHTEALAHLIYGVRESGGFIQLTGEVGTGKTTLVRTLLLQVPDTADVAVILNPQISRNEFLSAICEELGVPLPALAHSIKDLTSALNTYLLENHSKGRRTILIVDEAQNLRIDVLEQVRLLTNLETTKHKLLQIILIGQPELREMLARNDLRQLAQRITGRYHLEPLSREETQEYIDHRLKVAGAVGPIFSQTSKRELYRLTQGVPRMINVIADRALLGAFTQDERIITPKLLRKAASEVFDSKYPAYTPWYRWLRNIVMVAVAGGVVIGIGWALTDWSGNRADAELKPAQTTPQPGVIAPGEPDDIAPTLSAAPPDATAPEYDSLVIEKTATTPPATDQELAADAPITAWTGTELEALLNEHAGATDTDSAFATLFELWGLDYTRGTLRACQQAQSDGLYCMFQRGSLAQVRSLDRPVILSLRDTESRSHQVVLSGLEDKRAIVSIGNNEYPVSLEQLQNIWFGDYLLLWRPRIDAVRQFTPGMQHEDIKWLRESLATIQGEPVAPMDSDLFDQNLEARVRAYQRKRRLTVDGLVGYRTQIAINTDLSSGDRPRLARAN
ncbi:MAG: hypothetical protein E2O52_01450 [Gammaproteobacteria bacterium]|nr:MAG: hypothetical protein E2O52_01450 [Gammaproteobacteria bacterium]